MLFQHPLILLLDQLLRTPPHEPDRVSQHLGRLPDLDMHRLEPDTLVLVPRQRQQLAGILRVVPRPLVEDQRELVRLFGAWQLGVQSVVVAVESARGPVQTGETRVVALLDLGPGELEVVFVVDDEEVLFRGVLDVLLFALAVVFRGGGSRSVTEGFFLFVRVIGGFVVCGWAWGAC